jgi:hypothetical protein
MYAITHQNMGKYGYYLVVFLMTVIIFVIYCPLSIFKDMGIYGYILISNLFS